MTDIEKYRDRQTEGERERRGRDGSESYMASVIWKKVVLHTYTCRTNETHSFNEFYCVQLNVKKTSNADGAAAGWNICHKGLHGNSSRRMTRVFHN